MMDNSDAFDDVIQTKNTSNLNDLLQMMDISADKPSRNTFEPRQSVSFFSLKTLACSNETAKEEQYASDSDDDLFENSRRKERDCARSSTLTT